jgi:hypothetical protein
MKSSTRIATIAVSAFLCGAGIFIANSNSATTVNGDFVFEAVDSPVALDGYQFAASRTPKLTFQQLETIVRKDPTAKQQHGKIEFGSLRMEQGTAVAEVMFVSNTGSVLPFLYKLLPEQNSWKIVNVQRIWYVPRSRLLRGVRA